MARSRSRAGDLLRRVLATNWFDRTALAAELVVSEEVLAGFIDDDHPIPLDRQLCLAQFVIKEIPPLARHGRMLLAQVTAAYALAARTTAPQPLHSDLWPRSPRYGGPRTRP